MVRHNLMGSGFHWWDVAVIFPRYESEPTKRTHHGRRRNIFGSLRRPHAALRRRQPRPAEFGRLLRRRRRLRERDALALYLLRRRISHDPVSRNVRAQRRPLVVRPGSIAQRLRVRFVYYQRNEPPDEGGGGGRPGRAPRPGRRGGPPLARHPAVPLLPLGDGGRGHRSAGGRRVEYFLRRGRAQGARGVRPGPRAGPSPRAEGPVRVLRVVFFAHEPGRDLPRVAHRGGRRFEQFGHRRHLFGVVGRDFSLRRHDGNSPQRAPKSRTSISES
mmetsp:Transcript_42179/g.82742  ORF Transcript_42179/g.82742 Transcript_42179/m.82742 type:complete len:273 (-) Transcript_42179:202-1020(-)